MSDEQQPVHTGLVDEGFVDVLEAHRELSEAKVQLESLLDATDSLERLIGHLDQHEMVDATHKHSVQVSFENLLTSTAFSVNDVFPALEAHEQGIISTESLKDNLRELWKRIVSMVLNVLAWIKRFWNSIATYRGQLRLAAQHVIKHGQTSRYNSVKEPNIQLGLEIKSFVVGGDLVDDPDAVIRAISAALDQYKIVTNNYTSGMLEVGKKFERALTNPKSGKELLEEVCDIFDGMPIQSIASKMRAMVYRDPRFGRRLVKVAPPVIGGWSLFFMTLEDELNRSDVINYAQALRTTGIKFAHTNVNSSNIISGSVKVASGQQVEVIGKQVISVLDTIDAQEKIVAVSKIEAQVKNVLRAGERFTGHAADDSFDKSTMRFVRNYANWAVGPMDQMTTNLLTVSRNLLTYARKSLKNH